MGKCSSTPYIILFMLLTTEESTKLPHYPNKDKDDTDGDAKKVITRVSIAVK